MASYNQVILTGRVANTPRRHYRPDGSPVIQFSLELNSPGKSRDGRDPGDRSRIDIVAFGKLAEFDLLQNGEHLLVVGRLNQRSWQTPEGRRRTRTEVIATEFRKADRDEKRGDKNEKT
jgi:single-strand DNA-binding protein